MNSKLPVVFLLSLAACGTLMLVNIKIAFIPLLTPITWIVYKRYAEGKRREKIDEEMPRALLEISASGVRTYEDVLSRLSNGYGELSIAVRSIGKKKIPASRKILALGEEGGEITRRATRAIIVGMLAGANMRELLRTIAGDLESQINAARAKRASLSLQIYSTILTASIFVPLVLGITAKLVNDLVFTGLFPYSDSIGQVLPIIPIHVAVVAGETAVYVALLDGRKRIAPVYALIMIPLAVSIFLSLAG